MGRSTFTLVAAVIFAAIAVLHAIRIFYGWEAVIGGWAVPMWFSWVALVVSGYLAWNGWQLAQKPR